MSGLTGRPTSSRHGGRTLFEHDALVRPTGDVDPVLADAADWSRRGAASDVGGCAAPPDIGTDSLLLPRHGDGEALLAGEDVILVERGLVDIDLDPVDGAVERVAARPVIG